MAITHDRDTLDEVFDILESVGADPRKRDEFITAAAAAKPVAVKVGRTQVLVDLGTEAWEASFAGNNLNARHADTLENLNSRLDVAYRKFN